ncbi:probable serine/threonine-protein kinase WNK11 isoform X2 [Olea europaea var. sylvestris]|uniref:probable serine/threonine-protein kinase WNK11 isoform X2 n=1 Tax=Olea europaea var. sylvestris TaxID=158386 RepID=UPI000C1D096A|nr:probable serine/threonine-protein kinase WNK11 isoform X2 [Olea europaea var. sylvestris]
MARHSYTSRYGRYSELLGSGAVKRMYRAFEQEEGIEVAWNLIKLISFLGDEAMINRLYSKVRLLRTLKNKNIIALYSVWQDEEINTLNFIIEVCTSGNLREYKKKHRHVLMKVKLSVIVLGHSQALIIYRCRHGCV